MLTIVNKAIYKAQIMTNCRYPLPISCWGAFEFMPYAMSEYGHICPKSFARKTSPEIPPPRAIPIGKAKFLTNNEIIS